MDSKTQSQNMYHPRDDVDNSWMLELAAEPEEKKIFDGLSFDILDDDLPELYPPYDADATADHTGNCPLCGQPRNGPPALGVPGSASDTALFIPPLVRCLSEHHWYAGKVEMARKKRKRQWVGDQYSGGFDETDRSGWGYALSRNRVKYRGKTVRKVDRVTVRYDRSRQVAQEYRETDVLPIATQCLAHVVVKENTTGKGANKSHPRCKNKTYGDFCHVHRPRW